MKFVHNGLDRYFDGQLIPDSSATNLAAAGGTSLSKEALVENIDQYLSTNEGSDVQNKKDRNAIIMVGQYAAKAVSHSYAVTRTLMLCGDSITRGGATAQDDTTLAWRGPFWSHIQNAGSAIQLTGSVIGGLYWINASQAGGPCKLGDWHCNATGGWTLQDISTNTTTQDTTYGPSDAYILLGGENNNDGTTAAIQTILNLIVSFVQDRKLYNPDAIVIVCKLTPHCSPLAGFAAKNVVSNAVNDALPATLAALQLPYVYVCEAGALLNTALLNTDGQHPNGQGYAVLGESIANDFLRYAKINKIIGNRFPYYRKARARLSITTSTNTANANITSSGADGLLPSGNQAWSFGLIFQPTDLSSASQQRVVSIGAVFASGIYLFSESTANGRTLSVYIAGTGYFVANEALIEGKFSAITVTYNPTKTELIIYCYTEGENGKPISSCVSTYSGVPVLNLALGAGVISFGYTASYGVVSKGLKGDFWIALNKTVTESEAAAFYSDGALPSGITAYYPMNEGAGAALNPAPGFTALPIGVLSGVGQSWSAAGAVLEPWQRRADIGTITGSVTLNGATPVVVTCLGIVAGQEAYVTAVKTANGGTPGTFPTIVTGTDTITFTGVALDTSIYSWAWRRSP